MTSAFKRALAIALTIAIANPAAVMGQTPPFAYRIPIQGVNALPEPTGIPFAATNFGGTFAGTVGEPISIPAPTLTGGTTPYQVTAAGSLPLGLTVSPNGAITGIPQATGAFTATLTARDSAGANASAAVTVNVAPAPVTEIELAVSQTPPAEVAAGTPFSATLSASGAPGPYTYSASGLPAGLQLTGQTLSGAFSGSGPSSFTLTATNGTATKSRQFTTTVYGEFSATLSQAPQATAMTGAAITPVAITAGGGKEPYSFSATGSLPQGVGVNPVTGILSGAPTETGSFTFFLTASQSFAGFGPVTSGPHTIVVQPTPIAVSLASAPPTEAVAGQSFTTGISASGGPGPYTYAATGLPTGLSLSGSTLSGTFGAAGAFSATITASNAETSGTASFSTTVYDAFAANLSSAPQSTVVAGTAIAPVTVTATGGKPPYAYGSSGSLPPGTSISPTTGLFSGTPTTPGTYTFALTASHALAGAPSSSSNSYTLTVSPQPLELTGVASANKIVSRTQAVSLVGAKATGGTLPYTYAIESGTLPTGASLTADGDVTGTVTVSGGYSATIRVTDSSPTPRTATYALNIQVVPEVAIANTAVQTHGTTGTAYPFASFTGSGGNNNYTYTVGGTLPPGLTLNASGTLTGTPTTAGTYPFTVTATSQATTQGGYTNAQVSNLLQKTSASFTIVVTAPLEIATTALPNATATQAYTASLSITGGRAPYAWSPTVNNMPGGFTMTTANATSGAGTLAGTTTETNPRELTFTVTDADGRSATKVITLTLVNDTLSANRNLIDQVTAGTVEGFYPVNVYFNPATAAIRLAIAKDATAYAFNSSGGSSGVGFYTRNGASIVITQRFSQQVMMSGFSMMHRNVGPGTVTYTVATSADNVTWTPAGTYNFNTSSPGFVSDGYYGYKSGPASGTFATPRQALYVRFTISNSCQTSQCSYLTGQGTVN